MPGFTTIRLEKEGAVARIILNRPKVLNAYNVQMRDDFSEALAAVQLDPEIHSVLVSGEGRGFCAGADLTEFGTAPSQMIARRVRWERDVWGQLIALEKPIVTAIHGYCIGSGLEIALLTDLRIAAQGTVFSMPEVHLGMIPAAGGTQTLPRNIGSSRALDLLLSGRRFNSAEALHLKLVTRVVPASEVLSSAREAAQQLASVPPSVMSSAKRALRAGQDLPLADALQMETMLVAAALDN